MKQQAAHLCSEVRVLLLFQRGFIHDSVIHSRGGTTPPRACLPRCPQSAGHPPSFPASNPRTSPAVCLAPETARASEHGVPHVFGQLFTRSRTRPCVASSTNAHARCCANTLRPSSRDVHFAWQSLEHTPCSSLFHCHCRFVFWF